MLRRLGPCLLAIAGALALPAGLRAEPAAEQAGRPRVERLGEGWQAVAWRVGDRVVKNSKARIPEGDLMPFADPELREALTASGVDLYERLRDSAEFAAYRHVLVDTRRKSRFQVEQALAEGVPYDDLSPEARRVADADEQRLLAAARRAAPDGDFDPNHGNLRYFEDGRVRAFFDPAGTFHFADAWKARQPGAEIARDQIEARRARGGFTTRGDLQLFRLGEGFGRRVEGGELAWGKGLLLHNPQRGATYLVKYGFRTLYERDAPRELGRRREKLGELLGLPLEDEQPHGAGQIQHFEHGFLLWDPASVEGTSWHLDPQPARATGRQAP